MPDRSPSAWLDPLVALRRQVADGAIVLRDHDRDAGWEAQADARWEALVDRYVRAVGDVRVDHLEDAIATRDQLAARLETGWLMAPTDRVSEEAISRQFAQLLARYEACCDVVAGQRAVAAWVAQSRVQITLARRSRPLPENGIVWS